jgi:transposase
LRRVEQGESYRQIAQAYTVQGHHVSYQSIYRIIQALRKQQRGEQA